MSITTPLNCYNHPPIECHYIEFSIKGVVVFFIIIGKEFSIGGSVAIVGGGINKW